MGMCKICNADTGMLGPIICPSCRAKRSVDLYGIPNKASSESARNEEQEVEAEEGIPQLLLSTTDEIDGYFTVKHLGVVRGSTVRSRHVGSEIGTSIKSIVGGELRGVTKLITDAREQALARMLRDAESLGANGIKGIRFSTSQVWESAAEVLVYGTAVLLEPNDEQSGGEN